MSRFRPRLWLAASILALGTAIAGGVVAATQPSDEQALQPARHPADRGIDAFRRRGILAHEPEGKRALAERTDLRIVAAVAATAAARPLFVVKGEALLDAAQIIGVPAGIEVRRPGAME